MAALEVEGLSRHYGEREALSGVSLSLEEGQTLVVFGPNGAGKTTLLRVLATLLRPHAGSVSVFGRSLPGEAWAVRARIGLLGHEPLLYRELTARENLRFHARLHGVDEQRVEELLASVAMAERAREPLRTLSRGMVQRVAIARAMLHDPQLLLLDEPHANLDPAAVQLVSPLIGAASDRRSAAFFASTLVIAAVSVVLPWSMCPMVPTLTCGFVRSNIFFAIPSFPLVRIPSPAR